MASDVDPTGVVRIDGWGRGVEIRNDESVARLRGFVEDALPRERWAAVLVSMTRRDRHRWEERLRSAGLEPREVDRRTEIDPTSTFDARLGEPLTSRAVQLLALPAWLAIRLSGRKTVIYQVTDRRRV